jgi:tRNA modification GTPase
VEVPFGLDGLPLLLVDSAGLRNETNDAVEAIGIGRAEAAAAEADILLWMGAPTCVPETRALVIQIFGKADLPSFSVEPRETEGIALSTVRGDGLDHLIARLIADARTLAPRPDGYALSDRQRMILQRILSAIDEALLVDDEILLGELLRSALARLAELTGENATEAMLDHLFTGFCIGK